MSTESLRIHRLTPDELPRIGEINQLITDHFHADDIEDLDWAQQAFLGQYSPLVYPVYIAENPEGKIASFLACGLVPLERCGVENTYAVAIEWRFTRPEYRQNGLSHSIFDHMRSDVLDFAQQHEIQIPFFFGETVNTKEIELNSNKQGRKRIYCQNNLDTRSFIELPYYEPTDQINWKTGLPSAPFSHIARHLMIEVNSKSPLMADDILACVSANYQYIHTFRNTDGNDGYQNYMSSKADL